MPIAIERPRPVDAGAPPAFLPVTLTVDVHAEDRPADVGRAARWLHDAGIRATFFVPSMLFVHHDFLPHVTSLPCLGHEVGSHGHQHDFNEIRLLMRGASADLAFLKRSHALYEDTFACAPISFRSPAWCPLGQAAIRTLVDLGYRVDSSATPQRLPVFSSTPYANTWLLTRRGLHELAPGLLEAPTSSLLLPAASPSFLTLRRRPALAFLRLLLWEAQRYADRIVCVQFHVGDFVPEAAAAPPDERLSLGSFLLRSDGGLRFKVFLRERDPQRVHHITREIIETLHGRRGARFLRLRDLHLSKSSPIIPTLTESTAPRGHSACQR